MALTKIDLGVLLSQEKQPKYWQGVRALLHMVYWLFPDIYNLVHELAKYITCANEGHYQAMLWVLLYCTVTPKQGLLLNPVGVWNSKKGLQFLIKSHSDSDYAKCTDILRIITGCRAFFNGSPVIFKSATQITVSLSMTVAKGTAGVTCAQDMLYIMWVIKTLGLDVKKSIVLKIDNKGVVDLANNCSVGGCTRHVDVQSHFLWEPREEVY